MKKNFVILSLFFILIASYCFAGTKYDSFRPSTEWLDNNGVAINAHGGGVMFHKGKYYWYGEHKIEGAEGNKSMVGVHCYSSKDLYNWKDEGIVLRVSDDEDSDIVTGCIIERPKVIYNAKTKKFVMWFHHELKDKGYLAARSGVAVSNSPTGEFKFIKSVNPNENHWPENLHLDKRVIPSKETVKARMTKKNHVPIALVKQNLIGRDYAKGQMARDMTLFVDDDGKAYHIYSSEENLTTHIAELSDDFLSHSGKYVRAFTGRSMEAPAIMKHENYYYFLASGCSGWKPNTARSAVAKDIMGAWEEKDNPCKGYNPHENKDEKLTFGAQSTFILKVHGKKNAYIAMFDIWKPKNPIDGLYVWLPVTINRQTKTYTIEWLDQWDLSVFD